MPTITQIIDSKWFYKLKNGEGFIQETGDFTQNISGNIFEQVKLVATVRTFTLIETPADLYVTSGSMHWVGGNFDESLNIGDICVFASSSSSDNVTFEVTSVSPEIIYFTIITNNGFSFPFTTGDPDQIYVINPLTHLRYNWGLRGSNSSDNFYRSYLDDETLSYVVDGIGLGAVRNTNFVVGDKLAINSNPGEFRARFVDNSISPINQFQNLEIAQDFEIEHTFRIQDYSESDIINYVNLTKPDNYRGENTLEYNSRFEFRTVETNPETSKVGTYISSGNIGFFNENFNGRPNNYSISNLTITRVSNDSEIDDIASSEASKVTFTIESTENTFISEPSIVLNHFSMITDYEDKDIHFDDLFNHDQVRIQGVSTENSSIITEGKILGYSNNTMDVEFTINPNDSNLDEEQYFLSVLVGDSSRDSVNSDKVQLMIKNGVYLSGFDVEGLLGNVSIELFQKDCDPYSNSGNSTIPIISGQLIYTKLLIPVLGGTISSVELQTLSIINDEIDVVDTIGIDTSDFIVISGEQEINSELPTPYSLGLNGFIRKVSSGLYEIIFPYRLPFEKENAVSGLDDVFFDQNEPNQGKNESVYYQTTKGATIRIAYRIGMFAENRVTYYRYRTKPLIIKDFEQTL